MQHKRLDVSPSRIVTKSVWLTAAVSAFAPMAADARGIVSLNSRTDYNDNRTLSADNESEVTTHTLSPGAAYRLSGARYNLDVSAQADIVSSSDRDVEDDRVDYAAGLAGRYDFRRSTLEADVDIAQRSQFESQFEDAGVVADDDTRAELTGGASWTAQMTARQSLGVSVRARDATFTGDRLNDFTSYSGSLFFDQELSSRAKVGVEVSSQNTEFEDSSVRAGRDATLNFAALTWNFRANERVSLNGRLGARHVDDGVVDQVSWAGDASLNYAGQRWKASLGVSRDFNASGIGVIRETTGVDVSLDRDLTQRLAAGVSGGFRVGENVDGGGKDEFATVSPYLRWAITERADLRLSYTWREQDLAFAGQTAESNAIALTIGYSFPRRSLGD